MCAGRPSPGTGCAGCAVGATPPTTAATAGLAPVMGTPAQAALAPAVEGSVGGGATVVMSWIDARRLSFLFWLLSRMKYFWAWLATWGWGEARAGGLGARAGLGAGRCWAWGMEARHGGPPARSQAWANAGAGRRRRHETGCTRWRSAAAAASRALLLAT